MTYDDALTITGMVAAHWPGNWTTDEALAAYARALEPLDAELTTRAVLRCVNELEHYPRYAVLRQYVSMEKRHQEDLLAVENALDAQRMPHDKPETVKLPEWVKGWAVARYKYDDDKDWPAQDPQGFSSKPMPKADQERYMLEGQYLTIDTLFRPIGSEI